MSGLTQKLGDTCALPESDTSMLLAISRWVRPTCGGADAIDFDVEHGLIECLLHAQIRDAGYMAQLGEQDLRVARVLIALESDDLHVNRCRQPEVQDLADDVGRQECVGRLRIQSRQAFAQQLDVVIRGSRGHP